MFVHCWLLLVVAGPWGKTVMTVGDVVKVYFACDVVGVEVRGTIYNIASRLLGASLNTNKFVLCLYILFVYLLVHIICFAAGTILLSALPR